MGILDGVFPVRPKDDGRLISLSRSYRHAQIGQRNRPFFFPAAVVSQLDHVVVGGGAARGGKRGELGVALRLFLDDQQIRALPSRIDRRVDARRPTRGLDRRRDPAGEFRRIGDGTDRAVCRSTNGYATTK